MVIDSKILVCISAGAGLSFGQLPWGGASPIFEQRIRNSLKEDPMPIQPKPNTLLQTIVSHYVRQPENYQSVAEYCEDIIDHRTALKGANLRDMDFSGIDLTGYDLSNCDLEGANFTQATLTNVNLSGASLKYCNLTMARLVKAKLEHANLEGAQCYAADFDKAQLKNASLIRARLAWSSFNNADLRSADFRGAHGEDMAMRNTIKDAATILPDDASTF